MLPDIWLGTTFCKAVWWLTLQHFHGRYKLIQMFTYYYLKLTLYYRPLHFWVHRLHDDMKKWVKIRCIYNMFLLATSGIPKAQPCSMSTTAVYLESQDCHSKDPVNVTSCNGACGTFTLWVPLTLFSPIFHYIIYIIIPYPLYSPYLFHLSSHFPLLVVFMNYFSPLSATLPKWDPCSTPVPAARS